MKYKLSFNHIKDFGLNTVAFGVFISMQQLVIMPLLSKSNNNATFANIILFTSIFNIVCNVIGDELGNTRLVRSNIYHNKNLSGDFNIILVVLIGAFLSVCTIMNLFIRINWMDLFYYMLLIVLGIIRCFTISAYKLKQQFNRIFFLNILYCLGALFGVFVIKYTFNLAPFLFGELFSLIYSRIMTIVDRDHKLNVRITSELSNTIKIYGQLSTVSLITNCLTYLDRVLIYPILGATSMTVYYSVTAVSKIMSLVIYPISDIILAKLIHISDLRKGKIISLIIKLLLPTFVVFTIVSISFSYLGIKLLYTNYYSEAIKLLLPIGFATSLSLISSLIKPVILRFFNIKNFLLVNILYVLVFCIIIIPLTDHWGILGFAWANCLTRFIQCLSFYLIIINNRSVMEEANI